LNTQLSNNKRKLEQAENDKLQLQQDLSGTQLTLQEMEQKVATLQQEVFTLKEENTEEKWSEKLADQKRAKRTEKSQQKNNMTNTTIPTVGSKSQTAYNGSATAEGRAASQSFLSALGVYFMLYVNFVVCLIWGKNLSQSRDVIKDNKDILPHEEEQYLKQLCTMKIGRGRL
jgi:transketolase